jgi:hypothetical protein
MEMMILSEAFAGFWMMLTVYCCVRCGRQANANAWPWIGAGLSVATLSLARPNNLLLVPFFAIFLAWAVRRTMPRRQMAICVSAFLGCVAIPVLIWSTLMYAYLGYFGVSTSLGLSLTNKTIDFIHYAPPEDEPIRGILMKLEGVCPPPVVADSKVWFLASRLRALPIYRETGDRTWIELSQKLMRIDVKLIEAHPLIYATTVAEAFPRAWFPSAFPSIWLSGVKRPDGGLEVVKSRDNYRVLTVIARVEEVFLTAGYWALLLTLSAACCGFLGAAMRSGWVLPLLGWTLFLATLSSALVEYCGGRYAMPYEPVGTAAIAIGAWEIWQRTGGKETGAVRSRQAQR